MFYWRIYVPSTSEIMERGNYPTVEKAKHDARSFIESQFSNYPPEETYTIAVHSGPGNYKDPVTQQWVMADGPEVESVDYKRYARTKGVPR